MVLSLSNTIGELIIHIMIYDIYFYNINMDTISYIIFYEGLSSAPSGTPRVTPCMTALIHFRSILSSSLLV